MHNVCANTFIYFKENEAYTKYLQYCEMCQGYKSPRSHHCRKCDRWVVMGTGSIAMKRLVTFMKLSVIMRSCKEPSNRTPCLYDCLHNKTRKALREHRSPPWLL